MIPENIRKIDRPKNTIVQATKHDNIFLVVQRVGCKYVNGRRIPVNGHVIGHIIDGKYVEKEKSEKSKINTRSIHLLRFGNVSFVDKVGHSLFDSLCELFHKDDAINIYTLALLRASFGDVKDYQIEDKYEKSWASILFPTASMSKNSISKLLSNLGNSYDLIVNFMKRRILDVIKDDTEILIDGMLKSDNSKVNSFSGFSYKSRVKGIKDISLIAAIDYEKKEPLCAKVYPGNLPDFVNTKDFIEEFGIDKGIMISDKGFPLEKNDNGLIYLHPIKRSEKAPQRLGLYQLLKPIEGIDKVLLGSKGKDESNEIYYYLIKDLDKADKEEKDYIKGKKKDFDISRYNQRKERFGTICFISNMDLDIKDIYDFYKLRWDIELVFKMYKDILSLKTTKEHDNSSVIGSEFINYLSTIMTCRMKNEIIEHDLFSKYTFNEILDRLSDVIKTSTDENSKTWRLCSLSKKDQFLIETLGIVN